MQMKFGKNVLMKYFNFAKIIICFDYGYTFGKNGIQKESGLWAWSANENISHIKTTMIIESHWRHIKHDHLYKFHKPQVDHLCYIHVKKVLT